MFVGDFTRALRVCDKEFTWDVVVLWSDLHEI